MNTSQIKGHEAIAQAVWANGARTMFGLIGDGNLFFVNSYVRQCGGKFVGSAHEVGSLFMALGHAYIGGGVGVCTITHGPALTNVITALVQGVKASLPVVLVCADTAVREKWHQQSVDQRELVAATGAGFEQMRALDTIAEDVATAFRRAATERRPIVLNMPVEFQWQELAGFVPAIYKAVDRRATVTEGPDVDDAVGIMASAKRPIVLAGRGAANPQAREALLKLARRLDAPVATTLRAKDLFRGEANNLGIFGTLSTPSTLDVIAASDCIIAFGATMTRFTTMRGDMIKGKRLVQINDDPKAIGARCTPDAAILGDPGLFAELALRLLEEADMPPSQFFDADMAARLETAGSVQDWVDLSRDDAIDIRFALEAIDAAVPRNRTFVTDVGRFVIESWIRVQVEEPAAFLPTHEFGCIGTGLPHAIGAALADRSRPTLLLIGDGGFMLGGLQELHTAIRENLDLVIVLCNDGGYGAEHIQFRDRSLPAELALLAWPDFVAVARAMGARGVTVRNKRELPLAIEASKERSGPLLIDLKLDPNDVPAYIP
ncbi:conserved hypothetical protein [Burkholderiales bacterium 8X]|nr:conserved hypothetical protein [Burkholderiales bacterium 8X]